MASTPKDVSIEEAAKIGIDLLEKGASFIQKWTCRGCGERVSMCEPNKLFIEGVHEEKENGSFCGITTPIQESGCGITAVLGRSQEEIEKLFKKVGK